MKEIDFYPEICVKFKNYLESYFPEGTEISYAYNKSLPQLIDDIEKELDFICSVGSKTLKSIRIS